MRQKLTSGRIKDIKYPEKGKQIFVWDSEVVGLAVRVTSGSKAFIFQSKLNGKDIRITIGDCKAWAIDSDNPDIPGARQEARRLQTMIDQGLDPRTVKQEKIREQEAKRQEFKKSELTFGEVWPLYIEANKARWSERYYIDHVKSSQAGGKRHKIGNGTTKQGPLYPLLSLKLSEITPEKVKVWATMEAASRGRRAKIAFDLLRAFINWCLDNPDYKNLVNSEACNRRIKRQALPKDTAKTDCLQREQLPAWFEAVRGIENPVISAYLQTLLITGARREELAALKWENVNFKWGSIFLHNKGEGDSTKLIPLTPYVSFLLAALPRRNEYVFSSPKAESGYIQEPRIKHKQALKVAGIDGLTLHGLRRSFGTLSEWVEAPAGVIAQIMGHAPSATAEKHYKQRPLDMLKMWHEKIEAWILEQAGIKTPEQSGIITVIRAVNGL